MTASVTVTDLANAYYESWQNGMATFDEPRLRQILATDMVYEGPIAGRRVGLDPFIHGLTAFVRSMNTFHLVHHVTGGSDSAALYDCQIGPSAGTLRFAEFIHVDNDRIQSIRLVFDPAEFRRLTT